MSSEQTTLTISHSGARSPDITGIFVFLVIGESVGVHLVAIPRHPFIAAASALLGILSVIWLVGDYRALGRVRSELHASRLVLRVGKRLAADVPAGQVTASPAPAERTREPGQINATKPAEPNVLLTFAEPVDVRIAGSVTRPVTKVLLFVDEPQELLRALGGERGQ